MEHIIEVYISHDLVSAFFCGVCDLIDADIDDDRPFFDHISLQEAGLADGDDDDISMVG